MSTKKSTKSSEELKKQVEDSLDRTVEDLENMERRFTPGTFVDRVFYTHRNLHPRATISGLNDNPLGTTFLTLGTIMLAQNDNGLSGEQKVRQAMQKSSEEVNQKVTRGMKKLKDKAEEVASDTEKGVKQQAENIREMANLDRAKQLIPDVSPLTLASLGFGLGAVIGGTLPKHPKEEQMEELYSDEFEDLKRDFLLAGKQSLRTFKDTMADEIKAINV